MQITASPWITAGFAASLVAVGAIAAPIIAPATSLPAVRATLFDWSPVTSPGIRCCRPR